MVKNRLFLLIIFILLSGILNLYSQQTKLIGNFIKLAVDNKSGMFILYGRNSVKEDWMPLLDKEEQYKSNLKIYLNKIKVPFGSKTSAKKSGIDIKENKIYYYWNNQKIKVEIEYELVPSVNSLYADTLVIDLIILNLTTKMYPVDYLLCFDTYLGEESKQHFILPKSFVVIAESKIDLPCKFSNFQSFNRDKNLGITVYFDKTQQVAPDNIYFANWEKVNSKKGIYKVTTGESFDFKPRSINDSGAFIEYVDQRVYPEKGNRYRFIVSMKNDIKISEDYKGEKIYNEEIIKSFDLSKFENIDFDKLDLSDLLELLDKINGRLKDPDPLKEDEVFVYDKILREIKKRREK